MLSDLQMYRRFRVGLKRFLSHPLTDTDCRALISASLENRERSFLLVLKRAVFDFPASPYLRLLRRAGIEYGDIENLVQESGIEPALERLYSAGVHISIDEFKGKQPIRRSGLEYEVEATDFDNPLVGPDFELMTGGTSGARRRLSVDLDLLVFESAARLLFLTAHGLLERPIAVWRPVPPGSSGIKHALRAAKLGRPLDRWFDLTGHSRSRSWKSGIFLRTAISHGKRFGGSIPEPKPAPPQDPEAVCQWLADCVQAGRPAVLSCPASAAVRACDFAGEHALDISGSLFWAGGEPITRAKSEIFRAAGADSVNGWALSETGPIALGCGRRQEIDEVHILHSKIAVVPAPVPFSDHFDARRLLLTTLLPESPKLLLNVDVGDCGILHNRTCGCLVGDAGFPLHLHTIRSHEKLTAAGMHFTRADILPLVETVLPAAHGGSPVDYQFVQEECAGESRVSLVVSPKVGQIDDDALIKTALGFLGSRSRGEAMMAEHWQRSGTLRVVRHLPYVTPVGKTPAIWTGAAHPPPTSK